MPEFRGAIGSPGGGVGVGLILTAGRQYIFDVRPDLDETVPLNDAVLEVRDNQGALVVGTSPNPSDDEGLGANPQFFFTPTVTGVFNAGVTGFGNNVGAFVLSIFADDLRNETVGVAPAGALAEALDGRINYRGDLDIFEATLIAGLEYQIDVRGAGAGSGTLDDPVVRLLDGSQMVLGEDDNSGAGFNASLRHVATSTGVHFIEASGFGETRGDYRVAISEGLGTEEADTITGSDADDRVNALGGEDRVFGEGGADRLKGGADIDRVEGGGGRDLLFGNSGDDQLRGGGGDDRLIGARGREVLIGGRGDDRFEFNDVEDSAPGAHDVIRDGDRAEAMEGVGVGGGDRIDLRSIDANALRGGDQDFDFTGRGIGSVWTRDDGEITRVFANVDDDRAPELRIDIEDGAVRAEDYAARDFLL